MINDYFVLKEGRTIEMSVQGILNWTDVRRVTYCNGMPELRMYLRQKAQFEHNWWLGFTCVLMFLITAIFIGALFFIIRYKLYKDYVSDAIVAAMCFLIGNGLGGFAAFNIMQDTPTQQAAVALCACLVFFIGSIAVIMQILDDTIRV